MHTFQLSTKIITGDAAQVLKSMHIQRLLLVTDPFFAKNGTARRIAQAEAVEIFDQVAPDPTVTLAARGAALVQSFRPDTIAALGGGSAMDCAKAMAFFSGLDCPLIAIPTTSGSGSEVTDFAILTHKGIKHPLVDPKLAPAAAILDESLLTELPSSLIADGGFDLISHALEALAATGATPFTDSLASDAFCTALKFLPGSHAGNTRLRLPIHTAATMAGIAFNQAGLGLCHALAHALGGEFHIPHGRLNAILLPAVIDCNAPAAMSRYAELARKAGLSTGTDPIALRSLKNALLRLRRQLGMPETLSQAGISPAALRQKKDALITAVLADPCCKTNPLSVTRDMAERCMGQVQGHE